MPDPAPFKSPGTPLATSAAAIVQALRARGHEAYWVGGCVRDLLLGRDPIDYDIATGALPEEIEGIFSHTIPVGRKFGVVVVVEGGKSFQVATFRSESGYQDGRHPGNVTFTNAQEDARRRDFTVNGLFYDPASGQVLDWVEGIEDLRQGLVRTIGDPDARYSEDHLRLLRTVRFAAQLGFRIAPETLASLRRNVARISAVSAERIRDELIRLFRPPHAAIGFALLHETGLMASLIPELEATLQCEQPPEYHPEGTVFEHIRRVLGLLTAEAGTELIWSALLHDIGKPATATQNPETGRIQFPRHGAVGAEMAGSILHRLRFPRKQIEIITTLVRDHMRFKDAREMRTSTLRRLFLRPTFELDLELQRLDCLGSHGNLDLHQFLTEERRRFSRQPQLIPPLLRGRDLIAMGVSPGPVLGSLLREIRDLQLGNTLRSPDEARDWVRNTLARGNVEPDQRNTTSST